MLSRRCQPPERVFALRRATGWELEGLQHRLRPASGILPPCPGQTGQEHQVFLHSQIGRHRRVLGAEAHPLFDLLPLPGHIVPQNPGLSTGGRQKTCQNFDRSGFPRAVDAQESI